jgi:hypothetical protein
MHLRLAPFLLAALVAAPEAAAYGTLAHQALVDAAWEDAFVPALERRFPGLTPDALRRAHAFAYGGAVLHDLPYAPGGNRLAGDLMHYVRSGDFVEALAAEARTADELAFALGALAHWVADGQGHPHGVNRVVPLTYPKLRARHGDVVTWKDDPTAHLRVEFGFDVVQVARGLYAPEAYRRFIGFEVALDAWDRALRRTYGLALRDLLPRPERTVRSQRKLITTWLPRVTRVGWATKKDAIRRLLPQATDRQFVFAMSNAAFEREWGHDYDRPGLRSRIAAFLLRLVPKVGPLRVLVPKPPTPEGERIYADSFVAVLDAWKRALQGGPPWGLANVNLDVGATLPAGAYRPADEAWAALLRRHEAAGLVNVDPPLAAAALTFHRTGAVARAPRATLARLAARAAYR